MARSHTSVPSPPKVATFTLVLPISRTAVTPLMLYLSHTALAAAPASPVRRSRRVPRSEIEILDVVLGEDERRTQQDLAAVDDVELAELAGIDRGRAGFQLAVDHGSDHIGRGIA